MSNQGPQKRPQSDTGEEDMSDHRPLKRPKSGEEEMVQARKADVAPTLTCIGCNGFFRGSVSYCQNKHGLCSNCLPGDKKKCPVPGCGQKTIITLDALPRLVKDLKLPFTCKFKKDGCNKENAEEEVIADHEIECGYRKVSCWQKGCTAGDQHVMNFEAHLFSAHDFYKKCQDNPGKWLLNQYGVYKMWFDSETGLRFWAALYHNYEEKQWVCTTIVFAGKNVAKKFRAEMRLSSHDSDTSLIFNGNVSCLDNLFKKERKMMDDNASKEFHISDEQFKFHNKGHIKLGDHNKDKNGELMIPITIKIKKKKLNA